jgi:SNF2 family DNA or RNA helicase
VLYGNMDKARRTAITNALNDPDDPIRVLIATDTASEGLNLQETARLLLHYDIPWNPARIEQRNGRLDRHGQARDVTAYHFTSDDDADCAFSAAWSKRFTTYASVWRTNSPRPL